MRNSNPKNIILNTFENYEPLLRFRRGDDFKEWQKTARIKLIELLGLDCMDKCDLDFMKEEITEFSDFTQIRFSFQSETGYYVPAYIWLPGKANAKLRPMICLQGHSKGMHISLGQAKYDGDDQTISGGDRDFAVSALRNGYCPIVMEQRYMGECGGDEKGPGCCAHGRGNTASAMPSLLLGRCAIGERVWDVSHLIDVIQQYFPQLDSTDISCMGNSGGGTATFYAACIDERIKTAMPSCSVCTYLDSIVNLHHCNCNYIPGIARYFDMGDLGGLIAPRKLVIVAGLQDEIFPIDGVKKSYDLIKALYAECGCRKNLELVTGNGGHRFYADAAYETLKELEKNEG